MLINVTTGHVKKESCANVDVENREGRIEQTGKKCPFFYIMF